MLSLMTLGSCSQHIPCENRSPLLVWLHSLNLCLSLFSHLYCPYIPFVIMPKDSSILLSGLLSGALRAHKIVSLLSGCAYSIPKQSPINFCLASEVMV